MREWVGGFCYKDLVISCFSLENMRSTVIRKKNLSLHLLIEWG